MWNVKHRKIKSINTADQKIKMKKLYPFLLLTFGLAQAQIVNIPDPAFKAKLLSASATNNIATNDALNPISLVIDVNSNGEIELSEALAVNGTLDVSNAGIVDLTGIEAFKNIRMLSCHHNQLTSLDLTGQLKLAHVDCSYNQLNSLVFAEIYDNGDDWSYYDYYGNVDFPGFGLIDCSHNSLSALDLNELLSVWKLNCSYNTFSELDFSGLVSIVNLDCSHNSLQQLSLGNCQISSEFLSFEDIPHLNCSFNALLALDLSGQEPYSSIGYPDPVYIDCSYNQLVSLTLPIEETLFLEELNASHNALTTFNFSTPVNVSDLSYNSLTSLVTNLCSSLDVSHNELTQLTIPKYVDFLYCSHNHLTSLELNPEFSMSELDCSDNNLTYLCLKGSPYLNTNVTFSTEEWLGGNPGLSYVCVEPDVVSTMQEIVTALGYSAEVNSLCVPASGFHVTGTNRVDVDIDGCSDVDPLVPFIPFKVDTDSYFNFVTDATGTFDKVLPEGTHIIQPVVNNSYFAISPASATVTLPSNPDIVQDFCIVPIGVHPDLRVCMSQTNAAVPGFQGNYFVRLENRGTETVGTILNVTFDDTVMDFVSADVAPDMVSEGSLSWTIAAIGVLQSKAIHLQMSFNSPVDTPPLNLGDVLTFNVSAPLQVDEIPNNNSFTLNQTVVNAFDPNDKTCLEGNTIGPEMAGQFLHYLIRFENTGNYPAQIVTVEDMIDITKFDISSLEPIDGSHSFVTRITGNKVEFIFNNIMLPFDDANNDGWVLFRIKTKSTLVVGDSVSNTAGIYFNYNPPVITNTATTTFATMGLSYSTTVDISIWPNPARDVLHFDTTLSSGVKSVTISDAAGRDVMKVVRNQLRDLNVSGLSSGVYIAKIESGTHTTSIRFVKE